MRASSGTSTNPFGFTGHEHDEATGLIYAKARFYDPEVGRFLSEDLIGGFAQRPPTLNRYLYAYSNPLVWIDPTGLDGLSASDYLLAGVEALSVTAKQLGEGIERRAQRLTGTLGLPPGQGNSVGSDALVATSEVTDQVIGLARESSVVVDVTLAPGGVRGKGHRARQVARAAFAEKRFERGTEQVVEGFYSGDSDTVLRGFSELVWCQNSADVAPGSHEACELLQI